MSVLAAYLTAGQLALKEQRRRSVAGVAAVASGIPAFGDPGMRCTRRVAFLRRDLATSHFRSRPPPPITTTMSEEHETKEDVKPKLTVQVQFEGQSQHTH